MLHNESLKDLNASCTPRSLVEEQDAVSLISADTKLESPRDLHPSMKLARSVERPWALHCSMIWIRDGASTTQGCFIVDTRSLSGAKRSVSFSTPQCLAINCQNY